MANRGLGALAVAFLVLLLVAALYAVYPENRLGEGVAQPATSAPAVPTKTQIPHVHTPYPARTATVIEPLPTRLPDFSGSSSNNASEYHPLLWPNHVARWAGMPLKVFLNTTREKYIADYARAAETWENGTMGTVSFVLVDSPDRADITFAWIETVLSDDGGRLGWTEPSALNAGNFYVLKHAAITMRIEAGPCDADTSIINVVAHELGHALGLGHETRYNSDLMKEQLKCQFYELPAISENAKMALAELYRIPRIEPPG